MRRWLALEESELGPKLETCRGTPCFAERSTACTLPVCGFDSGAVPPGFRLRALPPTLPAGGTWVEGQGGKWKWGQKSFQCTYFFNYTLTRAHTQTPQISKQINGWEETGRGRVGNDKIFHRGSIMLDSPLPELLPAGHYLCRGKRAEKIKSGQV